MLLFEYDSIKSSFNKEKHGINFEEAKEIWNSKYKEFIAKSIYENRFAIIGKINDKYYTCIYCIRNKKIRIISCRRSRVKEVNLYENS